MFIRRSSGRLAFAGFLGSLLIALVGACSSGSPTKAPPDPVLIAQGKDIFRFDIFGDESFWTDTLHMNLVIMRAVDPTTALAVGLTVDTDSLPPAVVHGIQSGAISLTSPATTVAHWNRYVGVRKMHGLATAARPSLMPTSGCTRNRKS